MGAGATHFPRFGVVVFADSPFNRFERGLQKKTTADCRLQKIFCSLRFAAISADCNYMFFCFFVKKQSWCLQPFFVVFAAVNFF